ncbi:MAG: hypothetical protein KJN72_13315 [Woeseia sp.]|nr:hypothetical protein [Woeseia sp.]
MSGEFVDVSGERYYGIRNVDMMPPFFISVISNVDHWLFVSSTGGLTAGRVSPDTALFPYITVDKIHESVSHTGSKTIFRVNSGSERHHWEPFNQEQDSRYSTSRHLYKSLLGNKLCFEEINHDLQLMFRYTWATSDRYGFVRQCTLQNLSEQQANLELLDGLQNILPAGTPRFAQTNTSNLVDAYKWTELDEVTGLAYFTLYSGITDRAEPCESLRANTVFCLGLREKKVLISSEQLENFRHGEAVRQETHKRGIRGSYFVNATFELAPGSSEHWQIVADIEQSQSDVVSLRRQLKEPADVGEAIVRTVDKGSDELARIMAQGDGFQATAEENVAVHHYANVLFNILRGGVFADQYNVTARDFSRTVRHFNKDVYQRNNRFFDELPETQGFDELLASAKQQGDDQLIRLCQEYLPITFARRHGDPSRPWNQFAIELTDEDGHHLLSYQGNWRDIFQNWEALAFSFPEFIENIIAKFVNASTIDGYNPYRITKEGIDWEVEEPDDPWSYIGYWGDHQIIYLQKLLELSNNFHPNRLHELLHTPIFCYANVPYRIRPFEKLLQDPKSTVDYDTALAERIDQRVAKLGADGKLVLDPTGHVYQVNLLEKLLVPLLAKLSNLVVDGGIWMNTQRPEWNDANNALVGQGLSMVTLCYLRRYVRFLQQLLVNETNDTKLSSEVSAWFNDTAATLSDLRSRLGAGPVSEAERYQFLARLGEAASRYRQSVYQQDSFSGTVTQSLAPIQSMLSDALATIDHSIGNNRREDGLYHAYNLLDLQPDAVSIDTLYPMLEGQVAALSAGSIAADEAVAILEALFKSQVYRPDQHSFMLYPDRQLPGFLEKNRIEDAQIKTIPLLTSMLDAGDTRIVERDADGAFRFNADFRNVGDLNVELDALASQYGAELDAARQPLQSLFESVFDHQAFTGRSGTMFGFEGLGCIYWHMVSKLLLAVQENYFAAVEQGADKKVCQRLGEFYYRVRKGIGFNKTPAEFGAFPTDPYSHNPRHAGAQQPGMTGQAKEEVLTRFGELGLRISGGALRVQPSLLRLREFVDEPRTFRFLNIDDTWQEVAVPRAGLAFSWCQVPIIYTLDANTDPGLTITCDDGKQQNFSGMQLPADISVEVFRRGGRIRQLNAVFGEGLLFAE